MPVSYDQALRAQRNLQTEECLGCVNKKRVGQSLCPACYSSLPAALKRRLYVVEGYNETFYEALDLAKKRTFGHEVTIKVRTGMIGTKEVQFHRMGSEAAARSAARLKSGFVEVVSLTPFTCEQYVNAFGWGST